MTQGQIDSKKLKQGRRSLRKLMDTIGPFLPKANPSVEPAPREWRITPQDQTIEMPTHAQEQPKR